MRIEYQGTSLQQVLRRHASLPIEFVYLNQEEYNKMVLQASTNNLLKNNDGHWFTLRTNNIVFYLE